MSIADIDGDRRADLAIGVPNKTLGRAGRAGCVVVLRGSAGGLTTAGAALYSQNTSGIPDQSENNDVFGSQVRLADFNRDGKADLAISAPYENNGNGALWQLRGTSNGVSTSNVSLFGPKEYGVSSGSGIGETLLD
ncbi:FG-GAP repeat protein [Streptomyces echinatus]|uniref:FG-GAP repeat protein n=1 Tax=Streptomyces echinatus TaxID=67293 RepID=UPI0038067671